MVAVTSTDYSSSLSGAIAAAAKAHNVVVFTGAGMSADSGIGTFRGQSGGYWSGMFGTLALFWGGTPIGWKWTPSLVWSRYVQDFVGPIMDAEPHAGHVALQQLNDEGHFDSFSYVTMNVDGMHQAAGATNEQVAEVHGSVLKYRCMACDKKLSNEYILSESQQTCTSTDATDTTNPQRQQQQRLNPSKQPRCDKCGGRARPDVTLFTESLPPREWSKAMSMLRRLKRGDVMLVAGTSSVVYPAASIPEKAASKGVTIIEFNKDFPTPLSSISDISVEGRAAETFPMFVKGVLEKRNSMR